jgi:hypothetical protein
MKKNMIKTVLILAIVASAQFNCFAGEMQPASISSNKMLTFVIAIAALVISLFSLIMFL